MGRGGARGLTDDPEFHSAAGRPPGGLGRVTHPPETTYRVNGMEVMVFFSGVVARVNGLMID